MAEKAEKQPDFLKDLFTTSGGIPQEVLHLITPPADKKEQPEPIGPETPKLSTKEQILQILGRTNPDIETKVEALTGDKTKKVTVGEALGILLGGDAVDAKSR